MSLDPIRLARHLIDIPSTTDDEEQIGIRLETLLSQMGLRCRRQTISGERFNLLATTASPPVVLLCSHIDTVPPFFPSSEDSENIYGRGACDTKGIIAAMVCAGEQLLERDCRGFAFLFVVGEETDSIGAKRANEELSQLGSRYVVVGEPTDSVFVRATKGALTAVVRFRGVAAHSAYPERGDSAILKMASAIREINEREWGSHPVLGNTTVNIGVVRGGVKPNIVPAEAEAELIFRTAGDYAAVRHELTSLLARHDGEIVRSHGNDPVYMHVPEGKEAKVVAFNTDAPHLGNLGKPVLFGPGAILDAHGTGEKISKREINAAIKTYRQLVIDLIQ